MKECLIASLLILVQVSIGASETQTDWSGGGGTPGPVTDWGDAFSTGTSLSWYHSGELCLGYSALQHAVEGSFGNPTSVVAGDIDGNGYTDLIAAGSTANAVAWWDNLDGTGTSWTERTVDGAFTSASGVYPGNFDGDGDWDIAGVSYGLNEVAWWKNVDGSGTSWTKYLVDATATGAWSVHAADIDDDGDSDIVAAALSGDKVYWYRNSGTGTSWTRITVDASYNGPSSVWAADIDGDGDLDIAGAGYNESRFSWWENTDGTGTSWTEHDIQTGVSGPYSVCVTDVDQDGSLDVIGAAYYSNAVYWWRNADGAGTSWTPHTIDGSAQQAAWVDAGDIDGDGDVDIASAVTLDDDLRWYENLDGDGAEWAIWTLTGDYNGASSVCIADVNGDGDQDVAGSASYAGDIDWWEPTRYTTSGTLESSILNIQGSADWQSIAWTSEQPAGTSVAFQVRASNDPGNMGAWSSQITAPGSLSGYLTDQTGYVQYRALLSGTASATPILEQVEITWVPFTGVGEEQGAGIPSWGLFLTENPVRGGRLSLCLEAAEAGPVTVRVFDLSGRVIAESEVQAVAGLQIVSFPLLPAGAYLCTAEASGYAGSIRVVVID